MKGTAVDLYQFHGLTKLEDVEKIFAPDGAMEVFQKVGEEERKYPKCWYQPIDEEGLAGLALRFTLSQTITAAVSPGDMRLFRMAVKIAENFTPVTADEIEELRRLAVDIKPIFTV